MLGTKRLVELCHRMMSLDVRAEMGAVENIFFNYFVASPQALIHVSTAYCNCDRTEISEVIYTTPYNPDDIFSLVNWLPEDMLDKVRNCLYN